MSLHVIGITGRAQSGKSTFAEMIATARQTAWICSFADPLRDVVEAAFGSRYETQAEKAAVDPFWEKQLRHYGLMGAQPITGRRILQYVGTEVFRQHVHQDFWCMVMERRLQSMTGLVLIPDVRFENEAALVRRYGTLVHLFREGMPAPTDGHCSECPVGWAQGDDTVTNHSLDQLRTVAGIMARRIG